MNAMNAMILSLSPEVREAALDLKALRRKINRPASRLGSGCRPRPMRVNGCSA
jgi:hypothetical protein